LATKSTRICSAAAASLRSDADYFQPVDLARTVVHPRQAVERCRVAQGKPHVLPFDPAAE
jgi:hypothetical protein